MNIVGEVMKKHPEFCTPETRVPDLLYILKKYNFDEILIQDLNHHLVGLVKSSSVSDEALKYITHPFNVRAAELMSEVKVTIDITASIDDCLKVMKMNHLEIVPVIDNIGHCLGTINQKDIDKVQKI